MADLYNLSEEERREIGDYLDRSPDNRENDMLGRKRTESNSRSGYDVLGAIVEMSSVPSEYLEVDTQQAFKKVMLRIKNGVRD